MQNQHRKSSSDQNPTAYRDIVKSKLEEMERDGIIECSSSEWAFPVVLIKKRGSSVRMCVNYRRLNVIADADAYPELQVDDMIDALKKAKYITTLALLVVIGRYLYRRNRNL